jgi:hypothetical protein
VVVHNIVELKKNHITRTLVSLEKLFDNNDVSRKDDMKNQEQEVMECNIGTTENLEIVKISRALPNEQRSMYANLIKKIMIFLYGLMRT